MYSNLLTKLMLTVATCALMGCGNPTAPFATDPKYARDVIDCIYAGSITPIEDTFGGDWAETNYLADFVLEWTSEALDEQFGSVQQLTLQSSELKPAQGIFGVRRGCTITVWDVQADRDDFEMALYFKNSELHAVMLKTNPTGDFEAPVFIAQEYRKEKGLPPGWK